VKRIWQRLYWKELDSEKEVDKMRNVYGRCMKYGKKNILGRICLWVLKVFKGKKGWGTMAYKLDGLDQSEEEQ